MSMHVSSADKKAEIARDIVVAYLSHVKDEQLTDVAWTGKAIESLLEVVEHQFDVPEKSQATGFGLPPTLPRPTA